MDSNLAASLDKDLAMKATSQLSVQQQIKSLLQSLSGSERQLALLSAHQSS